jgi:hypothetical protein
VSAGGTFPATGVDKFDTLVVGIQQYQKWVTNLERRGFRVVRKSLHRGTAAEIIGRIVTIDPVQFRYVDLLHESRHVRQIERAMEQGVKIGRKEIAWFERGAYEYEQRLGIRVGFSRVYMQFIAQQIDFSWQKTYRQKYRFSQRTQEYFNSIWK